jgi:hypothetical protein
MTHNVMLTWGHSNPLCALLSAAASLAGRGYWQPALRQHGHQTRKAWKRWLKFDEFKRHVPPNVLLCCMLQAVDAGNQSCVSMGNTVIMLS